MHAMTWKALAELVLAAVAVNVGNTFISVSNLPKYRSFLCHDLEAIRLLSEVGIKKELKAALTIAADVYGAEHALDVEIGSRDKEWRQAKVGSLIVSPLLILVSLFLLGSLYSWITCLALVLGAFLGIPSGWKNKARESVASLIVIIRHWQRHDPSACGMYCEGQGRSAFESIYFFVAKS